MSHCKVLNEGDQFVSFMVEKDDSCVQGDPEAFIEYENDDDYYRKLSKQFYGSRHQEQVKKQPKSFVENGFIKLRMAKNLTQNTMGDRSQLNGPITSTKESFAQKLLQMHKEKQQTSSNSLQQSFKTTKLSEQKISSIKQAYQQLQKQHTQRKLVVAKQEPRTHRVRVEDPYSDQFNTQTTSRSTLNNSTKSTSKQEKQADLYFPSKFKLEKNQLFKLSFRNK